MNARQPCPPSKDCASVKLRLAALLAVITAQRLPPRRRHHRRQGGGIYAVRSACPIAGIPAGTGDITLFNPPSSRDSRAIDVTAAITDVRATCQDTGNEVVSTATFTVVALRRDAGPARQVVLPYFDVALQGGTSVVAKRVGQAVLELPGRQPARTGPGSRRPCGSTAPPRPCRPTCAQILTRPRKAGDAEAAVDPMADPAVRAAVAKATFEHLVGFQLTQDQLRYNAPVRTSPKAALTWASRRGQGSPRRRRLASGRPRGRVVHADCGAEGATAPGISQAPGPRAPDSLESVRVPSRRAAEGAKLSGASDRRGRQPKARQGRWPSHPMPERMMSTRSPQRSDRRDQARGTPFSGDPRAATAPSRTLDKLPLDALAPRARRPDGAVRRLRDAGPVRRHHGRASVDPRECRACSTSATWASCSFTAAMPTKALETLLPGDFHAAERHEAQIFAAAGRRWRDHRRSDGDPPRRRFLRRRQRRDQAWRHRLYASSGCRATSSSTI